MSAGEWWTGLAWFAAMLAGTGTAATLALRAWGPTLAGTTRVLAWSVLATAAVLVAHVGPAAFGVLGRPAVVLTSTVLAVAAGRLPRRDGVADDPIAVPEEGAVERVLGALVAVAGATWLAWAAFDQRLSAPMGFDAASAYLPAAGRWIQEGSLWGFGDWLPGFFFGSSPGNGSMLEVAAMLPWRTEVVARLAMVPFVALTALAVHCLAREAGAPRASAAVLGVGIAAVPVVVEPAVRSALLDPVLYATLAAGLTFLLRHHRTRDGFDLALAGTALGIAFGTKLYGFTAVPIVFGVWAGARLVGRIDRRSVARDGAAVVGLVVAFGGIWVLRNLLATGNPAFPVAIDALGLDAPADPARPLLGSSLLDYADEPSVWTGTLDHQFRIATGLPLVVVAAGVVAAAVVLVVRRPPTAGVAVAGLVTTALLTLAYAATPYSGLGPPGDPNFAAANVRYGIPALVAGAGLAGWVAGRLGPRVRLAAVPALAAGWVVAKGAGRAAPPRLASATRPLLAGAVVVLALGLGAAGQRVAERYDAGRYAGADPALDWLTTNRPHGTTVGLAGAWASTGVAPTYPAFGDRLQHEVVYVGPTTEGLLGTYAAAADFHAALDDEGIDVLLVGRNRPFLAPPPADPLAPYVPPEEAWATAAGYVEVLRSDRFIVLTRR